MNERIKELAEQADKWSDEEFHRLFLANETPDRQKLFKTKFAELIVRHCAYQCYLIGESGLAHELSDDFGFKFDFRKMMEDEDE